MASHSDINDVAPTSLADLVGKKSVIAQVRVALEAAAQDGTKFPSALLTGGAGLGKSQLARCISVEMGADFIEVLGQSIREPADLNAVLLSASEKGVIHIDECHELDKEFQVGLYLALDQRKILLNTTTPRNSSRGVSKSARQESARTGRSSSSTAVPRKEQTGNGLGSSP